MLFCLRVLNAQGPVTAIASLAADGSRIVTGSGDATLRVWAVEQGMCERQLIGHGSARWNDNPSKSPLPRDTQPERRIRA